MFCKLIIRLSLRKSLYLLTVFQINQQLFTTLFFPRFSKLNAVRIIIELIIVFAAQLALADLVSVGGYRPDFVLIYLIFRRNIFSSYQFIAGGFLTGLMQDFIGGGFIGLNALSKTAAAFLLVKVFPRTKPENSLHYYGGTALCILLHDLIFNYIYGQSNYPGFIGFLTHRVLLNFLYNFIIFIIFSLIQPRKRNR